MAYYPQDGGYGQSGGGGGGGGGQWNGPAPVQRRPLPGGYDNYGRGPPGPSPNQAYPPARPTQGQGYDRGYDSNPPFLPPDSRGDGRRHNGPPPGRDRPPPPTQPQRSVSDHSHNYGGHNQGAYGAYGRDGSGREHDGRGQQRHDDRQPGKQAIPKDRALQSPISPEELPWDNPFPTFPNKKSKPKDSSKSGHSGGSSHHGHQQKASNESGHSQRHRENTGHKHDSQNSYSDVSSLTSPPPRSHTYGDANGYSQPEKPLPQPHPGQRHNGVDHGGSTDAQGYPPQPPYDPTLSDGRSNTMPDRGFPDMRQELPYRGPNPVQGNQSAQRSFSFEGPISPLSPQKQPHSGGVERFDRSGMSAPHGFDGGQSHGPGQYEEVFDNYEEQSYTEMPPRSADLEEMPNFDAPASQSTSNVDSLHIGGIGGPADGRGRNMDRGAPRNYGARSRSQPNFRDEQNSSQGYGPAPEMPPVPRDLGPNGRGYPGPGRGRGGFEHGKTWSPAHQQDGGGGGYGRGQYPPQQRGPLPPRGPPAQFEPRPAPGYGPGPGQPHQRVGSAGSGPPPPGSQDSNPDALPSHPTPVRPGLMQNGGGMGGPPPPQRQFGAPVQMGGMMRAETMPMQTQGAVSASAPLPQKQTQMPVTPDELRHLRTMLAGNPGDQALTLELAKKLVEASSVLIGEKGRVDPKTRNKNREKYLSEALKLLKKLTVYNYPDAMFFLADCYGRDVSGRGLFTPLPEQREAFSLYQAAAKLNHAQAAYRVAVCCEMGQDEGGGTRRDPLKALQWYKRAATLGDTPAMYKVGIILLKGLLGQNRNAPEAIQYLQQAADRADPDSPHALHELGLLFESGAPADGVQRDEPYALQLFMRGAQLGYKFSQYRLGSAFEYGSLGCPVDPRQSIAWYSKAAVQEEHQSELALSGWYLTGSEGVIQQSDTEAFLWARKAAQAGSSKAEYAMGYFTEVGIGAPADLEAAKRWYWRAASQNYPKAKERLEDLRRGGARMQKAQVSRSDVKNNKEGECGVM